MKNYRSAILQLLVLLAAMGIGAGESAAQTLRECKDSKGKGECVEFIVRYRDGGIVQIVDSQKEGVIVTKATCKTPDCKNLGGNLKDFQQILLMSSTPASHYGCKRICVGMNCSDLCPGH